MNKHGFTLLELLVALAIFAFMSAAAFTGLISVGNTKSALETEGKEIAGLQRFFLVLQRDIEQAAAREIRDEFGEFQNAMNWELGNLEFTRNGWRNPARRKRSNLQRVAYKLEDDKIIRDSWIVLDRVESSEPFSKTVLQGINDFSVTFLDEGNQWSNTWPPPVTVGVSTHSQRIRLPRAVAVTIDSEKWGEIKRVFLVKG